MDKRWRFRLVTLLALVFFVWSSSGCLLRVNKRISRRKLERKVTTMPPRCSPYRQRIQTRFTQEYLRVKVYRYRTCHKRYKETYRPLRIERRYLSSGGTNLLLYICGVSLLATGVLFFFLPPDKDDPPDKQKSHNQTMAIIGGVTLGLGAVTTGFAVANDIRAIDRRVEGKFKTRVVRRRYGKSERTPLENVTVRLKIGPLEKSQQTDSEGVALVPLPEKEEFIGWLKKGKAPRQLPPAYIHVGKKRKTLSLSRYRLIRRRWRQAREEQLGGDEAMKAGRYQMAIRLYKKQGKTKKLKEAYRKAGKQALKKMLFTKAREYYHLGESAEEFRRGCLKEAELARATKKFSRAARFYKEAKEEGKMRQAYREAGEQAMEQKKYGRASVYFEKAGDKAKMRQAALKGADIAFAKKRYALAGKMYKQLGQHARSRKAYLLAGKAALRLLLFGRAKEYYRQAGRKGRYRSDCLRAGDAARKKKKYSRAIRYYREAGAKGKMKLIFVVRGEKALTKKRYEQAARYFKKAGAKGKMRQAARKGAAIALRQKRYGDAGEMTMMSGDVAKGKDLLNLARKMYLPRSNKAFSEGKYGKALHYAIQARDPRLGKDMEWLKALLTAGRFFSRVNARAPRVRRRYYRGLGYLPDARQFKRRIIFFKRLAPHVLKMVILVSFAFRKLKTNRSQMLVREYLYPYNCIRSILHRKSFKLKKPLSKVRYIDLFTHRTKSRKLL